MRCKLYSDDKSPSVVHHILRNRGIDNPDEWLEAGWKDVASWNLLENMEDAVKVVYGSIEKEENICVVVDCDQDGFASASMFINYLSRVNEKWAKEHISYILHEGKQHGLNDIWDKIDSSVSLVVCPDSASNDYECHEKLNSNSTKVLILDHHLAEHYSTAPLTITVNNQLCDYPNKTAVGGEIVWQFCRAYDELLGYHYADNFLDLCALALCGDMASLKNIETKFLVQEGLKDIHNPYFQEMVKKNQYTFDKHGGPCYMGVAFAVVPMTNAICRTGTMEEKDLVFRGFCDIHAFDKVWSEAQRGDFVNKEVYVYEEAVRVANSVKRRQSDIQNEAMDNIELKIQDENLLDNAVIAITCEQGEVPSGIAGLVANKIQAKYQRPAMVLTAGKDEETGEECYSGSMRNYSMSEESDFKSVLENTGFISWVQGHPAAAGCQVLKKNFNSLIGSLNDFYKDIPKEPIYWVDYIWTVPQINQDTILDIAACDKYWGQDIPESLIEVVSIDLKKCSLNLCGKNMNTLRMIDQNGIVYVKFGVSKEDYEELLKDNVYMSCVCKPQRNEWEGKVSGEFFIEDYELTKQWVF